MSLPFILATTIVTILVSFLFVFLLTKNRQTKPRSGDLRLPPGPTKLPIIGHLHLLGKQPHLSFHKLSQTYGPVMQLWLGSVPAVVVSSAEAAKQVLRTHDLHCCSRPPLLGPKQLSYNFIDVAFAPYNEHWKKMRKLFSSELVSNKRAQSFASAREAQVKRLIDSLEKAESSPVNLNEKLFALVDGIVGTVAFGKIYGTNQFKNREVQEVLDDAMYVLGGFSAEDFWPSAAGRFVDKLTGMAKRREKSFRELDGFFEMVLEHHLDPERAVEPEEEDLPDVLIKLWREQGTHLTKDHLKAMLLDTFIGAIRTTSMTILFTMAQLMKNPRVMKKVQDEIRSVLKNKRSVETADLVKFEYLEMVIKEVLRIQPPLGILLPRETTCHVAIGGFDVPPKTRIIVNASAIGSDPNSWKNPDDFFPERFVGSEIDFKGTNYELIPFGAGKRICPGIDLASKNVEFSLANLLYCFDWELPTGTTVEDLSMQGNGGSKTPLQLVPLKFNPEA